MNVLLNISEDETWEALPADCRLSIAGKAVNAILRGELYSSGTEQIELAITLAERGVNEEIIGKITRLKPEIFEAFITKKFSLHPFRGIPILNAADFLKSF
jgi:hypothetical protein